MTPSQKIALAVEALRKIADQDVGKEFNENVRGLSEEAFYESHMDWCVETAKEALTALTRTEEGEKP